MVLKSRTMRWNSAEGLQKELQYLNTHARTNTHETWGLHCDDRVVGLFGNAKVFAVKGV